MGAKPPDSRMIETRIKVYNGLSLLTDMLCVGIAFFGAVYAASIQPFLTGLDGLTYINLRTFAALAFSLGIAQITHIVSAFFRYTLKKTYGFQRLLRLTPRIIALAAADCLLMAIIHKALAAADPPLEFYGTYIILQVIGTIVLRTFAQLILGWYYTSKFNAMNILVVGTNERARDFYLYMDSHRFLGYTVTGFLDDINYIGDDTLNILGPLDAFSKVARENILDSVIIYLPVRSYYDKVMNIIEEARIQGVPVQHMYSFFDHKRLKASYSAVDGYAGMHIGTGPTGIWWVGCKRVFDILFSATALIFILPIILLFAIIIKIQTPGPAFFIQKRVGYHKRKIGVIKLRTMVQNAEQLMSQLDSLNEMDGPVFKIRNDPRITPIGRFLRKYNIDELPQFINVFLGDMSVVGPRPMAERDFQGFSEDWLNKRFSMRPGITCTWQIQPQRNSISFAQWMNMDMEYIDNWSFLRDMKIIAQTVVATIKGSGT